MKKIQFNNKSYDIPTKWEEVTLEQQIEVSEIATNNQSVRMLSILSAYTGIPVNELKKSKTSKLMTVLNKLTFINTPIPNTPIIKFKFSGETYYISESFIDQEFQDYVSIQTIIAEYKENIWKSTPHILAVMAKKEGESLDDYDVNKRAELFKKLPLNIVNGVNTFFLSNLIGLNTYTQLSSQKTVTKLLKEEENKLNLLINKLEQQRGGRWHIRLLTTIYIKLIKSLKKGLVKYYNSTLLKSLKMN
jgi:hypothetical protein